MERNSIIVVTKHSPLIYITADWFTGGSVPKMLQCTSSQNKMASHRSYTSEEVLAEIFADPDSDFDGESSSDESYTEEVLSESTESSESDESDELSENDAQENTPRPARGRGRGRGGGRGRARQHNGAAGRGARRNQQQEDALLEQQWTSNDQQPRIPTFTARTGLQVQLPNNAGVSDYLTLFLTDEFFDLLVEQTNLYAAQYKRGNANLPPNSRAISWEETNRNEMKKFLALVLLMGIVRKPEVSDYWSTNPLLKGSIFNSVMPRNRFQSILQFLHFADNSRYDANDPNHDRLYKVRPVVGYLVSKFKSVYIPEEHISIDEELLLWKGRLVFKQYIPLKSKIWHQDV